MTSTSRRRRGELAHGRGNVRRPSPQLSRRWQVTRIEGRPIRGRRAGGSSASDREQGVDPGVAGDVDRGRDTRSQARLAAARSVGANSRSAPASISVRYSSSGQGRVRSWVRSPASTWATGTAAANRRARRRARSTYRPGRSAGRAAARAAVRSAARRPCSTCACGILLAGTAELDARDKCPGRWSPDRAQRCCPVKISARRQPALGERAGDGGEFDRFRPGADDQPVCPRDCSLPPSSAAAIVPGSGPTASTEIVGVGLELEPHRRRRDEMVGEAVAARNKRSPPPWSGRSCGPGCWCRPSRSSRSAGRAEAPAAARTPAASGRCWPCPTGSCGDRARKCARRSSPPRGGKAARRKSSARVQL